MFRLRLIFHPTQRTQRNAKRHRFYSLYLRFGRCVRQGLAFLALLETRFNGYDC